MSVLTPYKQFEHNGFWLLRVALYKCSIVIIIMLIMSNMLELFHLKCPVIYKLWILKVVTDKENIPIFF